MNGQELLSVCLSPLTQNSVAQFLSSANLTLTDKLYVLNQLRSTVERTPGWLIGVCHELGRTLHDIHCLLGEVYKIYQNSSSPRDRVAIDLLYKFPFISTVPAELRYHSILVNGVETEFSDISPTFVDNIYKLAYMDIGVTNEIARRIICGLQKLVEWPSDSSLVHNFVEIVHTNMALITDNGKFGLTQRLGPELPLTHQFARPIGVRQWMIKVNKKILE